MISMFRKSVLFSVHFERLCQPSSWPEARSTSRADGESTAASVSLSATRCTRTMLRHYHATPCSHCLSIASGVVDKGVSYKQHTLAEQLARRALACTWRNERSCPSAACSLWAESGQPSRIVAAACAAEGAAADTVTRCSSVACSERSTACV